MDPNLPPNPADPEVSSDPSADELPGVEASDPTPPPPPPPPPPFQILRSKHDRKLGGVAGGLAAATGLDPTLVRLAIVLGCLTGWGILAYVIGWAVIPEEDPAKSRVLMPAPEQTAKYIRIGLTVVGVLGVLHIIGAILGIVSTALFGIGLFPLHLLGLGSRGFDGGEALLGLLLLVGGCVLLFRRHLPWLPIPDAGAGQWMSSGPTGSPSGTQQGSTPSGAGMALATISPGSAGGGATAGGYGPPPPPPDAGGPAGMAAFSARATAAARAARTNGPLLLVRAAGWLVGLWFLAAAAIGGVFWLTGALHIKLPALLIVATLAALGVLGYTLVRSRRIAAVIGAMALLLVPLGLGAGLVRIDGQAGDRSVTPIAMSDLEQHYRHSVGGLHLDLSRLQLPAGSRTPIDISMGAGQIEVVVPWDVDVESKASVGAGSFELFGNRQTGVNLNGRTHSSGQPGAPALVINGKAGAGEVVVLRAYEPFTHEALRTGEPVPVQCAIVRTWPAAPAATGSVRVNCAAADGVTQIPPLNCVVAASGSGVCRPAGEAEPAVDFANAPGTRHCQVPAGGGESTCTPPVAGQSAPAAGTFSCTIPQGGGPATCTPSKGAQDPNAPAPPASPTDPSEPIPPTTNPTAGPGEYRCTIPEGGGPATCDPA